MIYIIVILLLILVLANDTARGLLGLLIVGAIILAIAGGVLFGLVILGLWSAEILVGVFIVAAIVFIIVDQDRLRKK